MDVTAVTETQAQSAIAASKLTENFDAFLQLLTAQLQYQDPLEPLDSNEFVAQLVQFTEVEQSIESNSLLESLLASQNTTETTAALGYIDKTVEAKGNTVPLQNGAATMNYTLPATAAASQIIIQNSSGVAVASFPAATSAGAHSFTWNGETASGEALPEGSYSFVVTASDADGEPIETTTTVTGKVTGVETDEHGVFLTAGDVRIALSDVVAIKPETQDQGS